MNRLILLLCLLLPVVAHAEVGDKAASISQIWLQGALVGLAALLAGRWRLLLAAAILPFALFLAWGGYSMLGEPHIGPALQAEFDGNYSLAVYGASALMLSLNILGMVWGWYRGGLTGDRPRPSDSSKPSADAAAQVWR